MDMIKSNVADMKNVGMGRAAGTITAAAFLANAVDNAPWAHIDIAGTAWTQEATKKKSYNPKGATGFGVRLILDYLRTL
jgi:leucyl aminopeptidase